jgi:hypothetical protein
MSGDVGLVCCCSKYIAFLNITALSLYMYNFIIPQVKHNSFMSYNDCAFVLMLGVNANICVFCMAWSLPHPPSQPPDWFSPSHVGAASGERGDVPIVPIGQLEVFKHPRNVEWHPHFI